MTEQDISRWRREGFIPVPTCSSAGWASHAQNPTLLPLSERLWRIYFAARDPHNRGRMAALDVDPGADMKVLEAHLEPMLKPGPPGTFDHEASGPGSALVVDGQIWMYYTGLTVRRDVPLQFAIGLALSDDGLKFRRAQNGPVISTGPLDPYFATNPAVLRSGDRWRMWYVSGTGWEHVAGSLEPSYELRTVTSCDGVNWDRASSTAVAVSEPWIGLGRPWAVARPQGFWLWFCRRGRDFRGADASEPYRLAWTELDRSGVSLASTSEIGFENPPKSGDFDDVAQAYPCVLPYRDDLIMFYNGNDFGAAGLGWARLEGGAALAGTGGGN